MDCKQWATGLLSLSFQKKVCKLIRFSRKRGFLFFYAVQNVVLLSQIILAFTLFFCLDLLLVTTSLLLVVYVWQLYQQDFTIGETRWRLERLGKLGRVLSIVWHRRDDQSQEMQQSKVNINIVNIDIHIRK